MGSLYCTGQYLPEKRSPAKDFHANLLIGLSTSGNSKNVVNAIEAGRCLGIKTISLTGQKESRMSELSDVTIQVPATETYKVQEYHLPVYHYLCAEVEKVMFPE